ncbi:hypothetical protein CLV63_102247 [Murinocardiopsis flavida]|uniref:Uncharacterized protein n=1 Tax=Murinocardiopsis flavida TaxID=645275 RepID=A0A2P8DSD5_9ACTN|nr:hypothetical protein CLV63_102247 [Murinocardiopsis flavida]
MVRTDRTTRTPDHRGQRRAPGGAERGHDICGHRTGAHAPKPDPPFRTHPVGARTESRPEGPTGGPARTRPVCRPLRHGAASYPHHALIGHVSGRDSGHYIRDPIEIGNI